MPKKFAPPTIEEVKKYAASIGQKNFDAEAWWHYYNCIDWKVGKNKMVRWRSAVWTWVRRDRKRGKMTIREKLDAL
jgi:hypothetical protein